LDTLPEEDELIDEAELEKENKDKEKEKEKEKAKNNKKKKRKDEDFYLLDAADDVGKHPFFSGLDFNAIIEAGNKTRWESASSFPREEQPEFNDVEAVLQRFKDIDPASHLEKLGLWDG